MTSPLSKSKTCRQCKTKFAPVRPLQVACSPLCALQIGRAKTVKQGAKAAAADRKVTAEKLDALQTKPQLTKKAQTAFNRFIRARDAGKPCISCGCALQVGGVGGGADAGHYYSVGGACNLRFVEDNVHGQCKRCNRRLAGNAGVYRKNLIDRIGIERVEQIERDKTLRKYTKDGLREIARHYNAEARKLKATHESNI